MERTSTTTDTVPDREGSPLSLAFTVRLYSGTAEWLREAATVITPDVEFTAKAPLELPAVIW